MFLFFKLFTDKMGSGLLPNLDGQNTHAPINLPNLNSLILTIFSKWGVESVEKMNR